MSAGTRHHHSLRLAVDPLDRLREEMIQHDRRLTLNGVRVFSDVLHKQSPTFSCLYLITRRCFLVLQQLKVCPVGRIALKHIEDESLRDGLVHGVGVEWLMLDLLYSLRCDHLARLAEH